MHQQSPAGTVPTVHGPHVHAVNASTSGLGMPRSCSSQHQKPLEAACHPPILTVPNLAALQKWHVVCVALPRAKQVKTLILKWGRNSSTISHPFLLAAHNLNARCWLQPLLPRGQESPQPAGKRTQSCPGCPLVLSLHHTDVMGAELFLLRSSIQRNRHLNYVKEEISAKELLSSPVLWHGKQLNQHRKQGSCKNCSQEMPKLKDCPCSWGTAVLMMEATASARLWNLSSLALQLSCKLRSAPGVTRCPLPYPPEGGGDGAWQQVTFSLWNTVMRELIPLNSIWTGQAESPRALESPPDTFWDRENVFLQAATPPTKNWVLLLSYPKSFGAHCPDLLSLSLIQRSVLLFIIAFLQNCNFLRYS